MCNYFEFADTDRFGTKMLEKMGWSKGKGLGANLDGSLNFIKVAHKDNQKGMGFKDRDDQWTQHEDNFNALLKSFDTTSSGGSIDKDEADNSEESMGRGGFGFKSAEEPKPTKDSVFSGDSLEEQSKNSRSRVHYKKFTRGKDMARYSEQDLANIFGKRSLGDKHAYVVEAEPDESFPQVQNGETDEKTFGVTVIKTGLSVTDYFKAKMDAMQANRKGPSGSSNPFYVYQPEQVTLNFDKEETDDVPVPEKSMQGIQKNPFGSSSPFNVYKTEKVVPNFDAKDTDGVPVGDSQVETIPQKKSKKKRNREHDSEQAMQEPQVDEIQNELPKKAKKSKKKPKQTVEEDVTDDIETLPSEISIPDTPEEVKVDAPLKKAKKAKNKSKHLDDEVVVIEKIDIENLPSENPVPDPNASEKKKTKKRRHQVEGSLTTNQANDHILVEHDLLNTEDRERLTKKPKKSKKNKSRSEVENVSILIEDAEAEIVETSEEAKPKKKKKSREVIPTQPLHFPKFASNILTSLYDPNIVDVGNTELESSQKTSSSPPAPATGPPNTSTSLPLPDSSVLQETFELAKYKADIFRFFDLGGFPGATLGDVMGYGYSHNLQLKVVTCQRDDERIANFWDLALVNKYGSDAVKIKKLKHKKKYNIKTLEKKNLFKF